ncbi:MAG: acyl-CoA/acyl-ACP dehydrogenase [Burkholderiaceae bacterium]|nr:acyl-CoA/acyl-ACP dehydrogenase [Burkholderiaceae bacterium]
MGSADPSSVCADPDVLAAAVSRLLDPLVGRIDRDGQYPGQALQELGGLGVYRHHLATQRPDGRRDVAGAIDAMTAIGRSCGSSAFMAWCQNACAWYVEQGRSQSLHATLLPQLASGEVLGGTGMSNPMKYFAAIESLALEGEAVAGGFRVSGRLPWVSNLGPGHVFGTAFKAAGQGAAAGRTGGRDVMALIRCDWPGLTLSTVPPFLAMDGTGTYSLTFDNVFVPDDHILADPIGPWLKRIRNGFVLMQLGIGAGIVASCIDLMRESNLRLGHVNGFLEDGPDQMEDELGSLRDRAGLLAHDVLDDSNRQFAQVLTARLMASELTLRATQSAMLHTGAAGYSLSSPAQRRLREGYFVAIVTPAIKHLRKEIDRLMTAGAR